jgi:hypothetical protein
MQILPDTAPVPDSLNEAVSSLRTVLRQRENLRSVSRSDFIHAWGAIAFIAPGLHPDESDNPDGGWPVGWRCIANEAFRRSEGGELSDGELYPYIAGLRSLGLPWKPDGSGNLVH